MKILVWLLALISLYGKIDAQSAYLQTINNDLLEYSISDIQQISFPSNHLQIQKNDGLTQTIQFSGIRKIIFNSEIGIDQDELASIQVFPNPSQNTILISSQETLAATAEVISLIGQTCVILLLNDRRIDVSGLPAGIYLLKIGRFTAKFVKL